MNVGSISRIPFLIFCLLNFFLAVRQPCYSEVNIPWSRSEIVYSFAPLVRSAAPAVVNIYARRVVESRSTPFQHDHPFYGLFQNFELTKPEVQNSLGSGVILSPDGIVVSNYHVVGGATDIRVVLNDGKEYSASVLLSDTESDLAVLELEGAHNMHHLRFRDSESVEVGELVLAIGNPFGVGQTVSSGIVSGLARSGTAIGDGRGYFIQTDAPINPGNSGGALIDMTGRLIGINTSILTHSGGSNGIGFAIPASLVRQFVIQAQNGNTTFKRPWTGLKGQAVNAEMAQSIGLPNVNGMLVTAIHPQSPFLQENFKLGDIIVAIDGNPVSTPAEMLYRLSVNGLGGEARVTKRAFLDESIVKVPLIAPPNTPAPQITRFSNKSYFQGLVLSTINPTVEEKFDLVWGSTGFVILETGYSASSIGLQEGDIILAVNGKVLSGPSLLESALTLGGGIGVLVIQRGSQRIRLRFRH